MSTFTANTLLYVPFGAIIAIFSGKPPFRAVFLRKSLIFKFRLTTSNCGQRVKIAALSLVQRNAEKLKIPNTSLTVDIMAYRRNTALEIEFLHNICYNYIDPLPDYIK